MLHVQGRRGQLGGQRRLRLALTVAGLIGQVEKPRLEDADFYLLNLPVSACFVITFRKRVISSNCVSFQIIQIVKAAVFQRNHLDCETIPVFVVGINIAVPFAVKTRMTIIEPSTIKFLLKRFRMKNDNRFAGPH